MIVAILVQTGVYKPGNRPHRMANRPQHCHRDFSGATDLILPSFEVIDVLEGMKLVLVEERYDPKMD